MTDAQRHNLAKKALYTFQRLAMLGGIVLLIWMDETFFALVFCLFYWNRPEYDLERRPIRSRRAKNDHPEP